MIIQRAVRCVQGTRPSWQIRTLASTSTHLPLVPLWLDGQDVSESTGGQVTHKHSKTGKESCRVIVAGHKEVQQAVAGSKRAFKEWRNKTGWERRAVLTKVAEAIPGHLDAVGRALRADTSFSNLVLMGDGKNSGHLAAGAASLASSIEGTIPGTFDGSFSMVTREPFGPVLSIPAFNYPLTLTLRSILYPLACGNTVILKASPLLPQFFHLLGPLFQEAGLPDGALQVVHFDDEQVADRVEQLIAHEDVRMVNFTGSVRLGRILAAKCGQYLKPSVMELGGKSVAIVLPTADLKLAANNVLFGAFNNAGQICMSTEQVLVHKDIVRDFEAALKETAQAAQWTGGMEMARPGAGLEARQLCDEAVREGARIVYAASASDASDSSFPPTILSALPDHVKLANNESFSPLLTVHGFESAEAIVQYANAHQPGLASAVFSQDLQQALEVAKELEVGAVHINAMTVHDQANLPFGGWKDAGWGRFNGRGAVESFTQTKSIRIARAAPLPLHLLYKGM